MKKLLFGFGLCLSLIICCFGLAKTTFAWTDITGSLNGVDISDLMMSSDGSIYASGQFYDTVNHARVWKYSNNSWIDITGNLSGENASSLIEASNGSLYVAGVDNSYNVAIWNYVNGTWNDVTFGLDAYQVNSLLQASDGTIYAGGDYTDGADFFARVWKLSGSAWVNITDSNLSGYSVYALMQALDGSIYAGGAYFNVMDLTYEAGVWQYIGNSWRSVVGNLSGTEIYSLVQASDGTIYLGGYYFDLNTSLPIAKVWKGGNDSWQDLSLPVVGDTSVVTKVMVLGNIVYASGFDDNSINRSAKIWTYSNNAWSSEVLGEAASHTAIFAMLLGNDGFYTGGFVNGVAKTWKRDYTNAEWRIISEEKLVAGDSVTLRSALNSQTISGQELNIYFKNLPNKLTKNSVYWMKWQKFDKYPKKMKSVKKNALKRYWKLTTNLNKYKAKKSSQKFKVKVTFKYTQKLFNRLKKKNSLASKSNLVLKYKNKTTSWKELTSVFTDAKVVKKNKKMIVKYFTHFPKKTNYFAIGLK